MAGVAPARRGAAGLAVRALAALLLTAAAVMATRERRAGAPQAVDGKINSTAMITKITKITIITIIVKSTQPP